MVQPPHTCAMCVKIRLRVSLPGAAALILSTAIGGRELAAQSTHDFLTANIDSTVSPTEDFFQYANGTWFKLHPMPGGEFRWGIGNLVGEEISSRLRRISEDAAAKKAPNGSLEQLIGDFWFTGMDSATINRQGLAPLKPDFDRIDAIRNIRDLIDVVAVFHTRDQFIGGFARRVLFYGRVEQDEKNSDRWIYSLWQSGITMDPASYTSNDPRSVKAREAFRGYLLRTFLRLQGDSAVARRSTGEVYGLEAQLAKGFDPGYGYQAYGYHKLALGELRGLAPAIDWNRYMKRVGITKIDSVNVRNPRFYQLLDSLLETRPLESWKNYLRFWLVKVNSTFLDDDARLAYFDYDRVSTGLSQPPPRWQRVLRQEATFYLGQPLQRLYDEKYFPKSVKARYQALAESLRQAFRKRIENLDWMSDSTKRSALRKLARLKITIAVEHPIDFSTMPLRRDSYVLNAIRGAEWYHDQDVKKLNQRVDRSASDPRAGVSEGTYVTTNNEVEFFGPGAKVIVPGLPDKAVDDAVLYGASFLAHEISHAFDSEGRHYDASGNRVDWWTPADEAAFRQRAQVLIEEYNAFTPVEGLHLNGQTSLAENMADLVGLRVALDAFKQTEQFRKNELVDGFTPLQRFFLAYAYGRMAQETPESLAAMFKNSAYAPEHDRVNGVLMNIPEFYDAFGVRPGDRMFRPENARVKIW